MLILHFKLYCKKICQLQARSGGIMCTTRAVQSVKHNLGISFLVPCTMYVLSLGVREILPSFPAGLMLTLW